MKTRTKIFKRLAALFSALAVTSAFGQTTYTWVGAPADGTNLAVAVNWGGTLPSTASSDTAQWNGTVAGPLNLVYNNSAWASGFGQSGVNLYLTGGQTSPVNISTTPGSGRGPIAFYNITIDSGAGAFTFGGPSSADVINWIGRPTGAIHTMINNSVNTARLNPWIRYTAGGGATWTLAFSGTGNWQCDSYMINDNGPTMVIQVDGPGTVFWNPTGFLGANGIQSPVVVNGGKLVLQNPHPRLSNQAITLAGNFDFNMTNSAAAQTLSGAISGTGTNTVISGTLTLSGQSTYTGDTVLQGGLLTVNGTENAGSSGPLGLGQITFNGGTLGFGANNTFDYSSRFNTAAGQAYSIDTAGQSVTFATGLGGSGSTLTKLGAGTLTLTGASSYSGLTTVSGGTLVFQGAKSGSGNITVADSAALGVTATGTSVTPTTLTVGTSSGATLAFNNVNSTTTAPLAPTTLVSAGTITINVNNSTFNTIGASYPLLSWTSGTAPAVTLGTLSGASGNLTTNGNSIKLNITATPYKWTGNSNGSWDLATANNWIQSGSPVTFANGVLALFDDTLTANENVTIAGVVQPATITVNNTLTNYSITSSAGNIIGGSAALTKSSAGTLTLSGGVNTNTGVTTVSGGILSVGVLANGGVASDIGAAGSAAANLVLNGGRLQYTGAAAGVDRLFSVGTSGGTIESSGSGSLSLTNAGAVGLSGGGPRALTLTGTDAGDNTLAAAIGNSAGGATSLTKNGTGKWVLTAANTYSGPTTIANGVLQIGAGGASGTLGSGGIVNNGQLVFNRTGSSTVSAVISGSGAVTNTGGGTLILTGNNSYTGGTTINGGTVQLGSGGGSGSLETASPVIDNGLLVFNSTSPITLRGFNAVISGTGNVRVQGSGLVQILGANTYTGWTLIDAGATLQTFIGNEARFVGATMTNNGTLLMTGQEGNPATRGHTNNIVGTGRVVKDNNNINEGWLILAGTNTYTGGTFISGGGIQLGDGVTVGGGAIVGNVTFTNTPTSFKNARRLVFGFADDRVFTNNIVSVATDGAGGAADNGAVWQFGPGKVTLTGNNSVPGGTTIAASTILQAGNGGSTGAVGPGNVANDGTLIINRSVAQSLGAISSPNAGFGTFLQIGSGTTTLTGSNSATGPTIISNGTLVVSGRYLGGDLNVEGGSVTAAAVNGTVATLNVAGNFSMNAGTLLFGLNKNLAQSNSIVLLTNEVALTAGTATATGGTLRLINAGPAVQVGDKFTLFSQPVTGGGSLTIVSPGFTVVNNLAVDGSVTVTATLPAPTISSSVTGSTLNLSWPSSWTGAVHLQAQTNTLNVGLSTNWVTIPGTDLSNTYATTINPTNRAVFYRLINP